MQNENQKQALPSAYEIASVATMLMGKVEQPAFSPASHRKNDHVLQEALRLLMQAGRLRQRVESHLENADNVEHFHEAFLDAGLRLEGAFDAGMGKPVAYSDALKEIGVRTDAGLRAILRKRPVRIGGAGDKTTREAAEHDVDSSITRYKREGITRYQIQCLQKELHSINSATGRDNRLSKTKPKGRRKAVK